MAWGDPNNGTHVQVARCTGDAAQTWTFHDGALKVLGNKCLDVQDGNAQIWDCSANDPNQQWAVEGNTLVWNSTNTCLSTSGGTLADGTPEVLTACTHAADQTWTFPSDGNSTGLGSNPNPTPMPTP